MTDIITVLISFLLIFAGCTACMGGILWFLYRTPLRFEVSFSKNQKNISVLLQAHWSLIGIQVLPSLSVWQINGNIGHITLISKQIQKGTTSYEDFSMPESFPELDYLKGLLHKIIKFLPELFHHIKLDKIYANLTYGFGDPACTGCTYGYYHALRPLITSEKSSIYLTPDFNQLVLDGTVEAGIQIQTPIVLCIRGARLFLPDIIKMSRKDSL